MDFFDSPFYKSSLEVNKKIKTMNILPVKFPEFRLLETCDDYWKNIWKMIDEAQTYIWIITYTMDRSCSANYTLKKLVQASKRGVHVVVLLDDLNFVLDKELVQQLRDNGATILPLNRFAPYFLEFKISKNLFHRHHEKVTISDDKIMLGSSNLTDDYSGPLYGANDFLDLNSFMRNLCLKEIRQFFGSVADYYGERLHHTLSNNDIVTKFDSMYPDSIFNIDKLRTMRTIQPLQKNINQFVLDQIKNAKKSIIMIQPYYYPIKLIETALAEALERGVHVEMLTAAKRDPPALKPISNYMMMKKLINKGLKVYETSDKFLHMKLYQFDEEIYTMGSFNNDKVSWNINHELNLIVEGEEQNQKIKKVIDELRTKSIPVDPSIRVGLYRYIKIQLWDAFMRTGRWMSNRKKAIETEKQLKEYQNQQQEDKQQHQDDDKKVES